MHDIEGVRIEEQVRIHKISRSPACLCPPTKALSTDGPTDGPTDGRTHPHIESWLTTKNSIGTRRKSIDTLFIFYEDQQNKASAEQ